MGAFNKLHFDSETVLHSGIHKQENMRGEVDTHISYWIPDGQKETPR